MDNKAKRILFITHESSLSGAPILLLHLLKLIKKNQWFEFVIVVKRGGMLDFRFFEMGETIVLKPEDYQRRGSFFRRVTEYFFYRLRKRKLVRIAKSCDLIFSNTVTNGRLLKDLSFLKKPVVVYIHELQQAMQFYERHGDTSLSLEIADIFLAPANAVKRNLVLNYHIQSESILPLYYFFDWPEINYADLKLKRKEELLKGLNLPTDKFYVVGMGSAVLRKGIDLFVECCRIVTAIDPNIFFVWIGDFLEPELKQKVMHTIEVYNLQNAIKITGTLPPSDHNLIPFDLFALTSREDPYPLVVLEAAFLGIPAVAFSGSGGIEDFIGSDAGFLVDQLSAEAMAKKIVEIKNKPDNIYQKGKAAEQKVKTMHASPSLIFDQLGEGLSAAFGRKSKDFADKPK